MRKSHSYILEQFFWLAHCAKTGDKIFYLWSLLAGLEGGRERGMEREAPVLSPSYHPVLSPSYHPLDIHSSSSCCCCCLHLWSSGAALQALQALQAPAQIERGREGASQCASFWASTTLWLQQYECFGMSAWLPPSVASSTESTSAQFQTNSEISCSAYTNTIHFRADSCSNSSSPRSSWSSCNGKSYMLMFESFWYQVCT